MGNKLLEAGKVANTHGIRGEVRLQPWADSPEFLAGQKCLYIDGVPVNILSARVHKGCVIAALEGVDDIDAAIRLKNKTICIDRDNVALEEGRHFIADLIGLRAIDDGSGSQLGTIAEVLTLPGNNVYIIRGERDILVPAVPDFVKEINPDSGYIRFRLIEGM